MENMDKGLTVKFGYYEKATKFKKIFHYRFHNAQ